MIFEKNPLIHR